MPLKPSKKKDVIQENIREMLHGFKETGMIGNTKPLDMKHAQEIAVAAAYGKAQKGWKKSTKGKSVPK